MIIKAGYRLSVTSWENDGDNYQTHSIDGLNEEKVKNLIELVSLFESRNSSKNKFGNIYEANKFERENLDLELKQFLNALGDVDIIKDHWLSSLGLFRTGDFYTRVFEEFTVEYVPTEIVIEDVTKKFKGV
jgi:hypothetical protein